ncbi:hypothetical protein, partial [Rhodovulum strictum]|uniref:hypothetical protein n=1 Tax=Rhodovulum strictum TaxID=58314 RepID=UPI0031E1881D
MLAQKPRKAAVTVVTGAVQIPRSAAPQRFCAPTKSDIGGIRLCDDHPFGREAKFHVNAMSTSVRHFSTYSGGKWRPMSARDIHRPADIGAKVLLSGG